MCEEVVGSESLSWLIRSTRLFLAPSVYLTSFDARVYTSFSLST